MAALQASLSLSSSSSFFGQRLWRGFGVIYVMGRLLYLVEKAEKPCLVFFRLKRWERKECKPNSLPVLHKMHVKLGDTVKVISGRDKGKIVEITKIFKHNSSVDVGEINLKTKHVKSREEGEQGQIIKVEAPVHSSNVMLYPKDKEVANQVGHKILDDGRRVRYLVKTARSLTALKIGEQRENGGGSHIINDLINASTIGALPIEIILYFMSSHMVLSFPLGAVLEGGTHSI